MGRYDDSYWPPYVPVAERRRKALQKVAKMRKDGQSVSPVEIRGRTITTTFWGNAWNNNLEAYSDYSNRLPRGRTYVRNGSVIDLQIEAGRLRALVSGTALYKVDIKIKPLARQRWTDIKRACAGQIGSLVELLQGSVSHRVMEIVSRKGEGLFPSPREIALSCSCPDWAAMCKHVAATLYGVGARLDHEPHLLFTLRGVDATEMVEAAIDVPADARGSGKGRVLKSEELSSVFGVDIDIGGLSSDASPTPSARTTRTGRPAKSRKAAAVAKPRAKKSTAKKPTKKKKAVDRKGTVGRNAPGKQVASTSKNSKAAAVTKLKEPARRKVATTSPAATKSKSARPAVKKKASRNSTKKANG